MRRRRTVWQGFVWAYGLKADRLLLAFCRLVPLAWVKYSNVVYLRRRGANEFWSAFGQFKSWYWPHAWFLGRAEYDHSAYVLGTRAGRRIFVRMRHDFHYLLRERIGEALAKATQVEIR